MARYAQSSLVTPTSVADFSCACHFTLTSRHLIKHSPLNASSSRPSSQQAIDTNKGRRKSFGANSAEVVTIGACVSALRIRHRLTHLFMYLFPPSSSLYSRKPTTDQIRPDWEAKLAAVRAAVARRANRRIIMRQVGDRLIPVGVTSGRIHPLAGIDPAAGGEQGAEHANENEGRAGRRSRRRQHQQQPQDLNQLLGTMGMGGQDIEEVSIYLSLRVIPCLFTLNSFRLILQLMIMEAMRLSLLDHEEQQRKEAEEKKKKEAERIAKGEDPGEGSTNGENEAGPSSSASASASGLELPSIPTSSPIDVSNTSNRALLPPDSSSPSRNSSSFGSRASSADLAVGSGRLGPSPLGGAPGAGAGAGVALGVESSRSHSHSRTASASSHAPTPREGADPPPFSMLSAALAAHGAASAVLASSGSGGAEPAPANIPDASPSAMTHAPDSNSHAPTPASATAVGGANPNQSLSSLFVESAGVAGESYDALPSSPDSPSHRPLLLETPASENAGSESVFGPGTGTGE